MRFHIASLFPEMFDGPFRAGILGHAIEKGLVEVCLHNIRDYSTDRHRVIDDAPYGGGPGMVMKPEPLFACVEAIRTEVAEEKVTREPIPVVLLTPQGRLFNQSLAGSLSRQAEIILLCGRYEGVDERVHRYLADMELSIGDYVLMGGEPAAVVVVDAVTRLIPGVLGSDESNKGDSHTDGILQHPHYTRPAQFQGWKVPDIILSGDHKRVAQWRRKQAILRTYQRRPDLLERTPLTVEEQNFLAEVDCGPHPQGDL